MAEKTGRHWREDLPFTFDLPMGWDNAPALTRALALIEAWVRNDRSMAPWLGLPTVLRRMGITVAPLPCLVVGDAGQRFAHHPRPALLMRLLKQIRRASDDGLARLNRLEDTARRSAAAIAAKNRPGQLATLGRITLTRPCLAARTIAPLLGLTLSGAGKLLERATWRTYVTPDVALALGLVPATRGRPQASPAPSPALDTVLAKFDAEIAQIDARLASFSRIAPETATTD